MVLFLGEKHAYKSSIEPVGPTSSVQIFVTHVEKHGNHVLYLQMFVDLM